MKKILLFLLLLSATLALGQPAPFQLQKTIYAADPQGVAVDPTGNFFVAEAATGRVRKYNAAGQFLFGFGSFGNDTASFRGLKGLTLDPAGNVYTLELAPWLVRVQKFTAAGQFLKSYDALSSPMSPFSDYMSIAVDSKGTIYVASRYGCLLQRLSAAGQVLPVLGGDYGERSGQLAEPVAVAIDRHDNIYVTDLYGQRIQKFSPDWKLLAEFGPFKETRRVGWPSVGMAVDAGGNVYVSAMLDGFPDKFSFFHKYNAYGQSVAKLTLNSHRVGVNRNGTLLVVAAHGEDSVRVFGFGYLNTKPGPHNLVRGRVFRDDNRNCRADAGETGLAGIMVEARPGPYYAVSDEDGNYTLPVDTGSYTVRQVLPPAGGTLVTQTCPAPPAGRAVFFKTYNDTIAGQDFGNQVTPQAYLTASVTSARRRRCFPATTSITYCNLGSAPANGAKVHLALPEYVVLVSADAPYTRSKDKHYIFDVGNVPAGQCGTIQIKDSVVCNDPDIRGLTQCTKAWITPANATTPDPGWDQSNITLKARCLSNGRVWLGIYNTGTGAMTDSSAFRVLLDAKPALSRMFKLAAGDSLGLQIPANGQTVRFEADQRPGHPTKRSANVSIEACGTHANGEVSLGFVAQLPPDDAEPEVDTDCLPITDSFDPNDKLVLPAGISSEHLTAFGQELEYTVRFQNTGNDYAYQVVVIDTLSDKLDLSTLRVAGASHAYRFKVTGKGRPVLTFTFDDINLPDSTRDQAGSNGFIKFTVLPLAGLPAGTRIENFADIYFDYNPPVRTNTVYNTLGVLPAEITGGDAADVSVCKYNLPVSAGPDQAFCERDTVRMQAQFPQYGQGRWKRVSGAGNVREVNGPYSLVTGLGYGNNVFEWSIPDGNCATDSLRSRVTFTRYAGPQKPAIAYVGTTELVSSTEGTHYQWYCNNTPLAAETRSIQVTRGGTYRVSVDNGQCASELSDPYAFELTSPVLALLTELRPNPTGGPFTIVLPEGVTQAGFTVFDALGRMVLHQTATATDGRGILQKFDLRPNGAGVYLVKIQTSKALITKRVVLSR